MMIWSSQSISGKLMRMTLLVGGVSLLLAYISFLIYDLVSINIPSPAAIKQYGNKDYPLHASGTGPFKIAAMACRRSRLAFTSAATDS